MLYALINVCWIDDMINFLLKGFSSIGELCHRQLKLDDGKKDLHRVRIQCEISPHCCTRVFLCVCGFGRVFALK